MHIWVKVIYLKFDWFTSGVKKTVFACIRSRVRELCCAIFSLLSILLLQLLLDRTPGLMFVSFLRGVPSLCVCGWVAQHSCAHHHLNKFNYHTLLLFMHFSLSLSLVRPSLLCQRWRARWWRWWLRPPHGKRIEWDTQVKEEESEREREKKIVIYSRRFSISTIEYVNHNVNMNKFNGKCALKFRWIKLMKALKHEFPFRDAVSSVGATITTSGCQQQYMPTKTIDPKTV